MIRKEVESLLLVISIYDSPIEQDIHLLLVNVNYQLMAQSVVRCGNERHDGS